MRACEVRITWCLLAITDSYSDFDGRRLAARIPETCRPSSVVSALAWGEYVLGRCASMMTLPILNHGTPWPTVVGGNSMRLLAKFLVLLACVAAVPGVAGPLEDADAAAAKGDYVGAIELLRPLAERGLARAQLKLGELYASGLFGPQDFPTAASWYRKAADQGNATAQYDLGVLYWYGSGVAKNEAEATSLY